MNHLKIKLDKDESKGEKRKILEKPKIDHFSAKV